MNHPKITVVTVTYNCEDSIEKTIKNVLSQTYPEIEYIIIDGKSTDHTLSIINQYKDKITKIVSEADHGIFDAMNKGLDLATGKWISFMNSGDVFFDENTLSNMMNREIPENAGVIFGETYTVKGRQNLFPFIYNHKKYCGMGICHQSLLTRVDLAKKIRFQDSKFKLCADYNMIRTIFNQGYLFVDTHFPVSIFDLNGVSTKNISERMIESAKICHAEHSLSFLLAYIHVQIKEVLHKS